jgi:Tfp pilus assembly protein PilP
MTSCKPLLETMRKVNIFISLTLALLTSCNQNSAEDEVVDWISKNAIQIKTEIKTLKE